jgi:catechol 2,3-dioxygenase-like lactoylglutathione lyase family enzyme
MAITGVHAILYTRDADADRAWLADVLGLPSVDAGGGWLIFALPPAELACHPADASSHELFLMCSNLQATLAELAAKGVEQTAEVSDEGWGLLARIRIPGGGDIGLYEPRHPSPLEPFRS